MTSCTSSYRRDVATLRSQPIRPTIPPSDLQSKTMTLPPLTEIERLALEETMAELILQNQIR